MHSSRYLVKRKRYKKLLKQLKSGFKRIIKWNKYRSQMTIQSNNNNMNYLIDPTFTNVNRFLSCHLQEMQMVITEIFFSSYYVPNV